MILPYIGNGPREAGNLVDSPDSFLHCILNVQLQIFELLCRLVIFVLVYVPGQKQELGIACKILIKQAF